MSILCGTDLSPASATALDVAVAFAKLRGDSEVVLTHVAGDDLDDDELGKIRRTLAEVAEAHSEPACSVRSELLVGEADVQLAALAVREDSDLVVIAARSSRVSTHDITPTPPPGHLGTQAGHIIERSPVPVIVIRDPEPWLAFAKKLRPLKVLLGVDDSAVCDLGIQWLHRLRTIGPVEVVLGAIYYADDAEDYYGLEHQGMATRSPDIEAVIARDLLRRFGGDGQHVTAAARVGLGRIGDHVIELARELAVDAIVVGTSQKTGLGSLGSVSSVVVNDAEASVVCVPPQAQSHIPQVTIPVLRAALAATDLSPFANRAIPFAFAACEPDAEIHIVHIVDPDADVDVPEIERTLRALAPAGAKQKVTAHVVRGSDAAKTVAQTAARLGVDLIAICSHGRSGISRALFGSTADRLLRNTRLPVLVLRPS